jgi:hypothetical protein
VRREERERERMSVEGVRARTCRGIDLRELCAHLHVLVLVLCLLLLAVWSCSIHTSTIAYYEIEEKKGPTCKGQADVRAMYFSVAKQRMAPLLKLQWCAFDSLDKIRTAAGCGRRNGSI